MEKKCKSYFVLPTFKTQFWFNIYPSSIQISTLGGCETILCGIRAFSNLHLNWVMMEINVKNTFNSISWVAIFKELWDAKGPLANIVSFTKLFYGAPFYY